MQIRLVTAVSPAKCASNKWTLKWTPTSGWLCLTVVLECTLCSMIKQARVRGISKGY